METPGIQSVGLLYRCWEKMLLEKETLRCGHKRFSAEEMSLIYLSVQQHFLSNTTVLIRKILDCYVLVMEL